MNWSDKKLNVVLVVLMLVFNLSLAFYSTPVIDFADASAYIALSEVFMGDTDINLMHRSPLFSIIIAVFKVFFDEPLVYKLIIFFQYLLVGLTTWMIYKIFSPLYQNKMLPIITALLFNLSLSTIYFANILMTEIITVFFVILSLYMLIRFHRRPASSYMLMLGISVGFLTLARFNATPLIFTFLFLMWVSLINRKYTIRKMLVSSFVFVAAYSIILNSWFFYNYQTNGFYGLFPGASRVATSTVLGNAVASSIHPGNIVSSDQRPILDIYLDARAEYLAGKPPPLPGSFAKYDFLGILDDLYSGYSIRMIARENIRLYLEDAEDEEEYTKRLSSVKGFNREIRMQNRGILFKMRFASLFSGFRANASVLPASYGNINTNILPPVVFKIYKISFLLSSVFVFFLSFWFFVKGVRNKFQYDFYLLSFFAIVISFWFINFYFITVNDATRFKFPAEPLILGLAVYYLTCILKRLTPFKKIDIS